MSNSTITAAAIELALRRTKNIISISFGSQPEKRSGKERRKDGLERRNGGDIRSGRDRRFQPYTLATKV
jgi:hypothetical protein